ncbi:serine/threonine kinase [Aureococcus anophagefferens]|nr:serine/threonine kinase [Aureococcus anophagefferens]
MLGEKYHDEHDQFDHLHVSSRSVAFDEEYTLGQELGTGAMSVVRMAEHKHSGRRLAVKCIAKEPLNLDDEAALLQEVNILQKLDHPNIVKLHAFFDEPTMFYLVMDLIEGGELFERIAQKEFYSEKEARDLILILLQTIKYCHDLGIVHRDLKPENLLCVSYDDDSSIKLCDFGFAAKLTGTRSLHQLCGTPGYVAPEILNRQPYGKEVDMWSIGVLTYILLGGYPPFYDDDHEQLYERIKAGVYEFHDDFCDVLQHPWIIQDGENIKGTSLQSNLKELKQFQAKKRFKAAAKAVIATHRIKLAFGIGGGNNNPSKALMAGFNDIYEIGRELGTGALSIVKQCTHRSSRESYACKLNLEDRESLLAEAQLMKELDHPNIVKLHGVYDEKQSYYLVMDLIQGGELFDRIVKKEFYSEKEARDKGEKEARDLILVLLRILLYLHKDCMIVHRDIKPENLLCVSENDDTDIKLCDFGFAARLDKENPEACLTHLCGTPGYVAPEILKRVSYGAAVDMWSNRLYAKIKSGNYEFHEDYWGGVSKEGKDLIMKLLTVNPSDRITAEQALGHPWIVSDDEALKGSDLGVNLRAFKRCNAKRKFKSAGKALIAARGCRWPCGRTPRSAAEARAPSSPPS